jgi:hypothetical protein
MPEIMPEYKWSRREKRTSLLKKMPYKWRSSGKQLYAENSRKTCCARKSRFGCNVCECLSSLRNPFNNGGKLRFAGRRKLAGRRTLTGRMQFADGRQFSGGRKLADRRKFADRRKATGRRHFTHSTGGKPLNGRRQFAGSGKLAGRRTLNGWRQFVDGRRFAGLNRTIAGDAF